ncbi:MAG: hypothetical protein GKC10_03795 [Methanosarcinales archaeon]|nr:hypothetical protein [Methanosarcinales archaeon]
MMCMALAMKSVKLLIGLQILILLLGPSCAAQQIPVMTVSERSLSVDMGESFVLSQANLNSSSDGLFMYNMVLIDRNDTERRFAYLSLISVYDDLMKNIDPSTMASLFSESVVAAAWMMAAGRWATGRPPMRKEGQ